MITIHWEFIPILLLIITLILGGIAEKTKSQWIFILGAIVAILFVLNILIYVILLIVWLWSNIQVV